MEGEGAGYEANEGVGWRVSGLRTRREERQRSMSDGRLANSGGKLRLDQLTRIYAQGKERRKGRRGGRKRSPPVCIFGQKRCC